MEVDGLQEERCGQHPRERAQEDQGWARLRRLVPHRLLGVRLNVADLIRAVEPEKQLKSLIDGGEFA